MKQLVRNGTSVGALALAFLSVPAVAQVQGATSSAPDQQPPVTAQPNTAPAPPATNISAQNSQGNADPNDIIVTAQRRSERLQDVPIAISAVTGDSLAARGVKNLQDFTATLPSVNIQQRRSSGVVTIRGIGYEIATAGADPGVAVHTDGIYIARPAAAIANFFDVNRVEVARGPQGTLYGRNATGGAVNIITRAPTEQTSGYLDTTYGNFNALTVEGALSGPVSDAISARIAFRTDNHDGYGKNVTTGHELNDLNTRAIRGRIQIKPTSDLQIDLSADYYREKDANFTPHLRGPYVPTRVVLGENTTNPQDGALDQDTINNRKFWGTSATIEYNISNNIIIRSLTGYRNTNYYYYGDGDGTSLFVAKVGRKEVGFTWSQEFQIVGKAKHFNWVIGGYYFFEHNLGDGFGSIPSIHLYNNEQLGIQETNSYATYAQATYNITSSLGLTLGGRYTTEKKRLLYEATGTAPNFILRNDAVAGPSTANFNAFTPKASIDYHINRNILLYVSAQKGFKSGGYAIGAKTPAFRPETIWSYEAGIKATWFNGALQTNISAFHYDYKDLQVGFIQGLVSVVTNAASAKVDGLEAEITIRPVRYLTIDANGSLLNARYGSYTTTDPNRPALGPLDLSGNRLAQAPKRAGFVSAEYEIPVSSGSVFLRGEYIFSSKIYFDAFNQPIMSGAAYDQINAFLTYRTSNDRWSIAAFVRNLENKNVAVGGLVGSALQGGPVQLSYLPPRTYGLRAGYKF